MDETPPRTETDLERNERLNQTFESLQASIHTMVQGFEEQIVTLPREMIRPLVTTTSVSSTDASPVWLDPAPPRAPLAPNRGAGFTIPTRDMHVAAVTQNQDPLLPSIFGSDDPDDDVSGSVSPPTNPTTTFAAVTARIARRREILTPSLTPSTLPRQFESHATVRGRLLPTSQISTLPRHVPVPNATTTPSPRHVTVSTTPSISNLPRHVTTMPSILNVPRHVPTTPSISNVPRHVTCLHRLPRHT